MPFEYIPVEDAVERAGLRMVVVGNVPSPWGEAAKGILHIKQLEWAAVRLVYDSDLLKKWAGQRSGPILLHDQGEPRSRWVDILLYTERLAPEPPLLPADAQLRAQVLGLAHEICGEEGLGWSRRIQMIHEGLTGGRGFSSDASKYLSRKYGYRGPESFETARQRVLALLGVLSAHLRQQRDGGRSYYFGDTLTAVDVYSATFMALFKPLPIEQCDMNPKTRAAFESYDPATEAALDPILFEHRDMMYQRHLELPLSL